MPSPRHGILEVLRAAARSAGGSRPAASKPVAASSGQLVRAVPREGTAVHITVDGAPVEATAGDSVLAAMLVRGHVLRRLEFDGTKRAGFCLMGACQDCWVLIGDGRRVRACTTPVAEGMAIRTGLAEDEASNG